MGIAAALIAAAARLSSQEVPHRGGHAYAARVAFLGNFSIDDHLRGFGRSPVAENSGRKKRVLAGTPDDQPDDPPAWAQTAETRGMLLYVEGMRLRLQSVSDEPWVRLGIDTFWNAVDERWMEHGPRAAEGFAWMENARIVPGPVGQRLAAGMRAAVASCARTGNDMLVDEVFVDPAWLDGWRSELAGLEWVLVGVLAPLDVLEEREAARGNRIAGEARFQFDLIHSGIEYDVTVDKARQSPEECARAILSALVR